ncbi:GrBNV_gp81-like protein [Drosophila innubila nudivirus]|uniref:GrBNV_gp81-like protein n=1 Tax=Drosophila innubila nudivirus TaxID=2057187 RepID=A0A2H4UX48_9VIRU|nr:GrBNV_gp81-like protein [Drosophila innubila nudivirus]ATZ81491.1 GrBNV_gp81-like protein [Drosophila innubila nudivirus]
MLITIDSNVDNMAKTIADKLIVPAKLWCTALNKCSMDNLKLKDNMKSTMQSSTSKPIASSSSQSLTNAPMLHLNEKSHTCSINKSSQLKTPSASKSDTRQFNKRNVFYNTPISLADDIRPYKFNLESDGMFFIYLDSTKQELAYNRILNNLKNIPNAILMLNSKTSINNLPYPSTYVINTGNCDSKDIGDLLSTIISTHMLVGRRVDQQEMITMCQPTKNKSLQQPSSSSSSSQSAGFNSQNKNTRGNNTINKQINATKQPISYDIYDVLGITTGNNSMEIDDCHECS